MLSAPARPRKPQQKSSGAKAFARMALLRRPGRTLAAVVFAGVLCGIAANALFFQTARHPAPIFHGPVIARPAQPVAPPMPIPVPAPAAVASTPAPPPRPSEKVAALQPPAAPAAARGAEPKDQIGALLSGGAPQPAAQDASPRVVAAQKALVKLGYVVKPDGVMGAGTRKAVEMFEQSRKLPVTGELSPRVVRELSAASGVAVP